MAKYSDSELSALLSKELRQGLGSPGSEISQIRLRNLQYFKATAEGELAAPEITDRSSLVATDVSDTVEWMLPSLLRVFASSKDAMQCKAKSQKYVQGAKMAQDYLQHIFWTKNRGFHTLYQWFKDAMIQKVGFLKVGWEEFEEDAEETYSGLVAEQVQELMEDPDLKPIEQASRVVMIHDEMSEQSQPLTVYDVKFKRVTKKGRCVVNPCPPEEVRIHPRARYGQPFPFIAHVFYRSRQDLEADGYDLSNIGADQGWSMEQIERVSTQTPWFYDQSDGEMQQYRVSECYIKLDQDEDSVAEWLKVMMIGETVMDTEKVDDHPFVFFCPAPMPHTFFGQCPADWAIEPQRLRTSLLRSMLDNIYLSVNQRTGVVEGQVNLDDLLNSRPGGIVRMTHPGALQPIAQGGLDASAWNMVEWAEQWRETRTGFTRQSNGLNPDALAQSNVGSMGVGIMAERADQRIELMARMAAESVEHMFRKILKCVSMYQNIQEEVEINGQWANIDPRDWHKQYDIEINVGLGTGSKEKQAMMLGQLLSIQEKMIMGGVVDPQGAVLAAKNMAEYMGLPQPEQYFPPAQPKPPTPGPEEIKAQAHMQVEGAKLQATMQLEREKAQLSAQVEQAKQDAQQRQSTMQTEIDSQRDQFKAQLDSQLAAQKQEFDAWKAQLESNTRIAVAEISANTTMQTAQMSAQPGTDQANAVAQALEIMSQAVAKLTQPRSVVRGPDGRIVGVQ
jgi:hypothetical protein